MKPEVRVTRRTVLSAGVGLAGAALIAGSSGVRSLLPRARPDHLVEASYRPLVGSAFTVDGAEVGLHLVGVRHLGALRVGSALMSGREHFALDFEGPAANRLASSQHQLSHPAFGRFVLFLTPVGQSTSVQRYEAVVNRYEITIGRRFDV